jgi:hypothetical protein
MTSNADEKREKVARAIGEVYDGSADPVEFPNNWARAIEAADAAIAAYEAAQWRTIESAPKDGTRVDLWVVIDGEGQRVCDVLWDSLRGLWDEYEKPFLDEEVKYWRPLPPPPAAR